VFSQGVTEVIFKTGDQVRVDRSLVEAWPLADEVYTIVGLYDLKVEGFQFALAITNENGKRVADTGDVKTFDWEFSEDPPPPPVLYHEFWFELVKRGD